MLAPTVTNLVSMFDYEFMCHAFLAGSIIAILAGIVGYFVVIRNLVFAGHALSHVGFAGASGALVLSISPLIGQWLLTLCAAMGMGALGKNIGKNDIAIGIILAFSLGVGSLLLNFYSGYAGQATLILFGNLLGVSKESLLMIVLLAIASLVSLGIIARPLLYASLQPELAEAKGISLLVYGVLFLLILATTVTLASQVVGVLLVFTLLIGPAAIATQRCLHFWSGIFFSTIIALIIVWLGITLSYLTDWPISFWISALAFIGFLVGRKRT